MTYQVNEWTNFGDASPVHGQLWIENACVDNTDDFATCVEVIGSDETGLGDSQFLIIRGSIYMPIDDAEKVKSALDCIGKTSSLATWIDKALAFNAYHGIDPDTWAGETVVQIGKCDCDEGRVPDVVLHGNAKIENYLRNEVLV